MIIYFNYMLLTICFIVAWDLGVIVLGIPNLKKSFFKIWILRYHRKICRLFPCIPIFRGGGIKSVKRVCIWDYDKNCIVTCEKCFFQFEWGYKRKSVPGSPKTYCLWCPKNVSKESKAKMLFLRQSCWAL